MYVCVCVGGGGGAAGLVAVVEDEMDRMFVWKVCVKMSKLVKVKLKKIY